MKVSFVAAGVAATALLAGVAGCGDNKSSSPSSSSSSSAASSSSKSTSSSSSAQPADYTKLLIPATDINVPGDTFTMQEPQVNPSGKPGVAAGYANQAGTRELGITILMVPSESDASGTMEATKTAAEQAITGAQSQPADVGSGGATITGTSADGTKAATILVFSEGKAVTTIEFDSAANDPVPPEVVLDVGQKQDAAIKAGLPG
jgi:hypothetical protein